MTRRASRSHHALLMADYYSARDAWWSACEAETALYAAEVADFRAHTPQPTFRAFLIDRAGEKDYDHDLHRSWH